MIHCLSDNNLLTQGDNMNYFLWFNDLLDINFTGNHNSITRYISDSLNLKKTTVFNSWFHDLIEIKNPPQTSITMDVWSAAMITDIVKRFKK